MTKELPSFIERSFGCTPEVAQTICSRARLRNYARRAVIIRQGEPCREAFLLVIGRARAFLVSADGDLIRLWDYEAGDLFGAVPAAHGQAEKAEVSAVDEVEAAIFRTADFLSLVETYACVGLALSRALVRQLAHATEAFVVRATLSATGRIHAELLRLAHDQGGWRISPPPVLSDLALRVQSTRETVSRTINALQRRGIILRDAEALTIVAPARLEEMIV